MFNCDLSPERQGKVCTIKSNIWSTKPTENAENSAPWKVPSGVWRQMESKPGGEINGAGGESTLLWTTIPATCSVPVGKSSTWPEGRGLTLKCGGSRTNIKCETGGLRLIHELDFLHFSCSRWWPYQPSTLLRSAACYPWDQTHPRTRQCWGWGRARTGRSSELGIQQGVKPLPLQSPEATDSLPCEAGARIRSHEMKAQQPEGGGRGRHLGKSPSSSSPGFRTYAVNENTRPLGLGPLRVHPNRLKCELTW